MKKNMLRVILRVSKWCSKIAYKLGLENEMEEMVLLSAKIQIKLDELN